MSDAHDPDEKTSPTSPTPFPTSLSIDRSAGQWIILELSDGRTVKIEIDSVQGKKVRTKIRAPEDIKIIFSGTQRGVVGGDGADLDQNSSDQSRDVFESLASAAPRLTNLSSVLTKSLSNSLASHDETP